MINPRSLILTIAATLCVVAPSLAGVTSFSASGSLGYSGQLTNQQGDTSDFSTGLNVTWDGVGAFDQADSDSATLDGGTLNATTRLQMSTSESGGVTTLSYLESYVTTTSGPIERVDIARDQSMFVSFTTTEWTRLEFTGLSGSLLGADALHFVGGELAYTINLTSGSPVVEWGQVIPSGNPVVSTWNGVDVALLLSAGSWTLELSDSFFYEGYLGDHLGFDMQFSSFPVPGPAGVAGLAGLLFARTRRRR